eukprot:UN08795
MTSVICKHAFQKDAIENYIFEKSKICQTCTFLNTTPGAICSMCDNVIKNEIKCPIVGCTKNISTNDLIFDEKIVKLVEKSKSKANDENILESSDSDDDDDDYIRVLNDNYDKKKPKNDMRDNAPEIEILTPNYQRNHNARNDSDCDSDI